MATQTTLKTKAAVAALFAGKMPPPPPPLPPPTSPPPDAIRASTRVARPEDDEGDGSAAESMFAKGLRQELSKQLAVEGATEKKAPASVDTTASSNGTSEKNEVGSLKMQLQALAASHEENEEAWRKENAHLRDQLTAAAKREAEHLQRLQDSEERVRLLQAEVSTFKVRNRSSMNGKSDDDASPARTPTENAMMRFIVDLVGCQQLEAILAENPRSSPSELREAVLARRAPSSPSGRQPIRMPQVPPSTQFQKWRLNSPPNSPSSDSIQSMSPTKRLGKQQTRSPAAHTSSPLDAVYDKFLRNY